MWLAYLNEALMISSAVCLAFGWRAIRQHKIGRHRRLMVSAAWLGALFFITYVVKTLLIGDTTFGGPVSWSIPYQVFLQTHATLATVAGVLGIITLRLALRARFGRHRRVAPWTATLWLIAAGSGLMVFLLLYVVFPSGATTNVLQALLGR
jgi:putative membrane protein